MNITLKKINAMYKKFQKVNNYSEHYLDDPVNILSIVFVGLDKEKDESGSENRLNYLIVSEDNQDSQYIVNQIKVIKKQGQSTIEYLSSMPYYSSSNLEDALQYLKTEEINYKKYLLHEKLNIQLTEKPPGFKTKI